MYPSIDEYYTRREKNLIFIAKTTTEFQKNAGGLAPRYLATVALMRSGVKRVLGTSGSGMGIISTRHLQCHTKRWRISDSTTQLGNSTAAREEKKARDARTLPRSATTAMSSFPAAAVAQGADAGESSGSPERIWQSSSRRRFSRGVHISISSSRTSGGAGLFLPFFLLVPSE